MEIAYDLGMNRGNFLVYICCALLAISCEEKRELEISSRTPSMGNDHRPDVTIESNNQENAHHGKRPGRTEKSEAEQTLGKFACDWENVTAKGEGLDTLTKQKDLALAVIQKLGGGDELLKFLDYLSERSAGDLREELLDKHLGVVFTGPDAEDAREWLLTVEDEKLRESLSRLAGLAFKGVGFKDYFEQMGQYGGLHSQAALLSGYCQTLAITDPEAAVKVYKELGYPKRIDNTGLAEVFAAMPPSTDFLKFATGIGPDTMTLAKRSRRALLRNWASVKPEDAAQYVLANGNSGVAPDQMAEVVSAWAKATPDSAGNWLGKVPDGKAKDEGTAALARHWSTNNPAKAWEYAAKVGDFQKRVETATGVFNEWEKMDREAATKAWVELFPPTN
jgi:hypothetical protein